MFLDLSEVAVREGDLPRAMDMVDAAVDVALETREPPERSSPCSRPAAATTCSRGPSSVASSRQRPWPLARTTLGALQDALGEHPGAFGRLQAKIKQHAGRRSTRNSNTTVEFDGEDMVRAELGARRTQQRGRPCRRPMSGCWSCWRLCRLEVARQRRPGGARRDAARRGPLARETVPTTTITALSGAARRRPATEQQPPAARGGAQPRPGVGPTRPVARWTILIAERANDPAALEEARVPGRAANPSWDSTIEAYGKALTVARGPPRPSGDFRASSCPMPARRPAGLGCPADARASSSAKHPGARLWSSGWRQICTGAWGLRTRLAPRLAETLQAKNPDDLEPVFHSALALRRLSRTEEALTGLTTAVERGRGKQSPTSPDYLLEAGRGRTPGR